MEDNRQSSCRGYERWIWNIAPSYNRERRENGSFRLSFFPGNYHSISFLGNSQCYRLFGLLLDQTDYSLYYCNVSIDIEFPFAAFVIHEADLPKDGTLLPTLHRSSNVDQSILGGHFIHSCSLKEPSYWRCRYLSAPPIADTLSEAEISPITT